MSNLTLKLTVTVFNVKMVQKSIIILISLFCVSIAFEIEPRIHNGDTAKPGRFPYYVLLDIHNDHSSKACGGALIDKHWVLTAAHCVRGANYINIHFAAFSLFAMVERGRFTIKTYPKNFHIHPNYGKILIKNDIALIQITEDYEFSKYVQPISLPSDCNLNENVDTVVMGHGVTGGKSESLSPVLQSATLRTKTRWECVKSFPLLLFRKTVLCAESQQTTRKQSVCQGDSGSPMVRSSDNTLIGITSFGPLSGCDGYAQAFTDVIMYHGFISKITGIELPKCDKKLFF